MDCTERFSSSDFNSSLYFVVALAYTPIQLIASNWISRWGMSVMAELPLRMPGRCHMPPWPGIARIIAACYPWSSICLLDSSYLLLSNIFYTAMWTNLVIASQSPSICISTEFPLSVWQNWTSNVISWGKSLNRWTERKTSKPWSWDRNPELSACSGSIPK